MSADLIAYETIRYRCPWCRKTGANKSRMARHAAACHRDPAQRTCLTCVHDSGIRDLDATYSALPTCALNVTKTEMVAANCHAWTPKEPA